MILRAIAMAGGLAGAAGLSQYPEFAQQYTQRLAGQVQALDIVVADFDATAARSGLTREQALGQMTGTGFLEDRARDLRRTFARHARLGADYARLSEAAALERILMPHRLADAETFRGTLADFAPGMPLTLAGGVAAGAGFVGGWAAVAGLLALLLWPLRRRRARTR